ncbi:hypothetical protein SEEE5646_15218, partial [Salmonella enterica subsp. enterica serovar Enteritidis str. 50-5646]
MTRKQATIAVRSGL